MLPNEKKEGYQTKRFKCLEIKTTKNNHLYTFTNKSILLSLIASSFMPFISSHQLISTAIFSTPRSLVNF
jgi:hypothetical protein